VFGLELLTVAQAWLQAKPGRRVSFSYQLGGWVVNLQPDASEVGTPTVCTIDKDFHNALKQALEELPK
jgi:hypothetical protein